MDAPLALAFGAGMLAAVNPCGFAMLPAYLSYFCGLEGSLEDGAGSAEDASTAGLRAVPRALSVTAVMTAGFVAVFGLVGPGGHPALQLDPRPRASGRRSSSGWGSWASASRCSPARS